MESLVQKSDSCQPRAEVPQASSVLPGTSWTAACLATMQVACKQANTWYLGRGLAAHMHAAALPRMGIRAATAIIPVGVPSLHPRIVGNQPANRLSNRSELGMIKSSRNPAFLRITYLGLSLCKWNLEFFSVTTSRTRTSRQSEDGGWERTHSPTASPKEERLLGGLIKELWSKGCRCAGHEFCLSPSGNVGIKQFNGGGGRALRAHCISQSWTLHCNPAC